MSFEFIELEIPGLYKIKFSSFNDGRGFFSELYKFSAFDEFLGCNFVQDNISYSKKNVIRGLHFQTEPFEQGKLVGVISGKIFDVAVDIRPKSETFGKYKSLILDQSDNTLFYIPAGFAHGFCALSENTIVHYKCTSEYSKENERGILWNDSELNINWPVSNPTLSEKDSKYPSMNVLFKSRLI